MAQAPVGYEKQPLRVVGPRSLQALEAERLAKGRPVPHLVVVSEDESPVSI